MTSIIDTIRDQEEGDKDPETRLREMWTAKGVPEEKQEAILKDVADKAKPGAMVGPFRIPLTKENFTQLSLF